MPHPKAGASVFFAGLLDVRFAQQVQDPVAKGRRCRHVLRFLPDSPEQRFFKPELVEAALAFGQVLLNDIEFGRVEFVAQVIVQAANRFLALVEFERCVGLGHFLHRKQTVVRSIDVNGGSGRNTPKALSGPNVAPAIIVNAQFRSEFPKFH